MLKNVIGYSDPSDFTYDSSEILISNNEAKLATKIWDGASSEVAYWNFFNDSILDSFRGNQTLTLPDYNVANPNTGEVSGGWLNLTNDDFSYAIVENMPAQGGNQIAVSCKVKPNFTSIGPNMNILTVSDSVGLAEIRFYFQNGGGGVTRIWCSVTNNAGGVTNTLMGTRSFSVGDIIEVGAARIGTTIRLYLDGVDVGAGSAGTIFFFDTDINVGGPYSSRSNFSIKDLQIWNGLDEIDLTIAGGGLREPQNTYSTLDPVATVNTFVSVTELLDLSDDTFGENPPDTEINYVLNVNGVDTYYNEVSEVWEFSDLSYAKSNTPQAITANLGTLDLIGGTLIGIKAVFHSTNGINTPIVSETSLYYKNTYSYDSVPICNIMGTVLDGSGNPVVGASIYIEAKNSFNGASLISKKARVLSQENGSFSLPAVETATTSSTVDIIIEYKESSSSIYARRKKIEYNNITIPNQVQANLSDIV